MAASTVYGVNLYTYDVILTGSVAGADAYASTSAWTVHTQLAQATAITLPLMFNILIGDAIVWWRACAVWSGHRPVYIMGAVFITAIASLLVSATAFTGLTLAAYSLSLLTNLVATALIGFRAWQHRRFLREYLGDKHGSRSLAVLSLLVESGVGYCVIWVVMVAIEAVHTYGSKRSGRAIYGVVDVVGRGFLPLAIAIYPMVVIILVSVCPSVLCDQLGTLSSVPHAEEDGRRSR
ncbi:uncharacterized protein BXZ73DRAFT_80128 [Epithele typhae]|uniref:uncharacterized protein n=1 Tax=Epithele typhae TaxID=378194 RepID=UPI002007FCE6|nr:uncharacterized protein BXZ73DRAFT_80128 [Epithele typhae]KAH9920556.1 hypothetical protein BXZ73DRAFT_80128 [Epithele typhae]